MFNKTKKIIIIVIAVLVLLETLILGSLIVYQVTQNSYEHYIETAGEYEAEEDYEQAISEYNKAIAKEPGTEEAYLGLADIYVKMEDYDKAIKVLQDGYDATEARSLSRKLEKLQKQLEEVETTEADETVQTEAAAEATTEELDYVESPTPVWEEFSLDEQQKEYLESMCRIIPQFQNIRTQDNEFWWSFLFYSFTEGSRYCDSFVTDDYMYQCVSEEDLNRYTREVFGVDFPGIDCETDYNRYESSDGEVYYTVYYEDGYYYISMSDGGEEWYQVDDVESDGFGTYYVTCGMYGPNDDYTGDEWYGVNDTFTIETADNEIGFIITSNKIVSEDN